MLNLASSAREWRRAHFSDRRAERLQNRAAHPDCAPAHPCRFSRREL